jgi:transcription initiation factor TFIID subunit TAF12
MRPEKSSELKNLEKSKSQGRTALQEEIPNIAMVRKKIPLPMMRRSIFSSLTEACTLQSQALQMPDRQRSTQSADKASWNQN